MVRWHRGSQMAWYHVSREARSSSCITVSGDALLAPCWSCAIMVSQPGSTRPCLHSHPSDAHGLSAPVSIQDLALPQWSELLVIVSTPHDTHTHTHIAVLAARRQPCQQLQWRRFNGLFTSRSAHLHCLHCLHCLYFGPWSPPQRLSQKNRPQPRKKAMPGFL